MQNIIIKWKKNKDLSTVNSFNLNKNWNIVHACKINKCVEKKSEN